MVQKTEKSIYSILTILFIIFAIIPPSDVYAGAYDGYYFPWEYGKVATLTQTPKENPKHFNQIDFVVGTTGFDVAHRQEQSVSASKDGVIWFAKDDSSTECKTTKPCPDMANLVVIKHPGNPATYTWYMHLSKGSIPPQFKVKGTPVRHGEVIGRQGRTGNYDGANGVHLHFLVSKGYSAPKTGKRLPSWTDIVSVTFKNGNSNFSYSNLTKINYTSRNTPDAWTQLSVGGYCLDLTDGINRDFTNLQVYKCGALGSTNQKWALNILNPSVMRIRSSLNNQDNKPLCGDVKDGSILNPVQVYACVDGNTNQTWQVIPVSDGYYQIKSKNFNVCMAPIALENRKQIKLKTCNTGDALQKWKIVELP